MTANKPTTSSKKNTPKKPGSGGMPGWVIWVALFAAVTVIAVAAIVLSKGKDKDEAYDQGHPVTVTGKALPVLPEGGEDPAVGRPLPVLSGKSALDTSSVTIPKNGKGKIIVVMAHWCPHCQAEIPRIVSYLEANPLPANVEVYGLSTRQDVTAGNYPPSAWLKDAGWDLPTLTDSKDVTGGEALGLRGLPFFVVADPSGKVLYRSAGEIPMTSFAAYVKAAAGGSA